MKRYYIIWFLLFIVSITSCGKQINAESNDIAGVDLSQEDYTIVNSEPVSMDIAPESKVSSTIQPVKTPPNKKIIRKGNITIESKNSNNSKKHIDKLLKDVNGYYESENTNTGSSYTNYTLEIRVPSEKLDYFLEKLESGDDKIKDKTISAEDITLQYVDIESRLKSKRAYLERYQQMIYSAKTTKDLLEIEEQIRQLQEDIESNATILRSLSDQVNYSTITLYVHYADSGNIDQPNSFNQDIVKSLTNGWNLIKDGILALISLWPIILIIYTLYFSFKIYRRRKKIQ